MVAKNMSFNPAVKTRLMARLCLCVSVLALSGCGTTGADRYAFWRSSNSGNDAPDLRNMPNNSTGDNQARNKLNGLQQQLMADHAAAITALQSQGAPTVSVLSSAKDIVPITQNKVLQQPLMPPPLPVKLPNKPVAAVVQPTVTPPKITVAAAPTPKTPTTWSGVSVLPQSINSVPAPAKTPAVQPIAPITAPVVNFVAPKQTPTVTAPPIMPTAQAAKTLPIVAEQPLPPAINMHANIPAALPTPPTLAPTLPNTSAEYQPKPLRTYTMPAAVSTQKIAPPMAIEAQAPTPAPIQQVAPPTPTMVAPAPIAQAMADNSSIDINMDALDNFAAPTPLMQPLSQPKAVAPPIRAEVAAAQQPYAYGYSNYSIKREMFESNQGNPIPTNDSVLINPIWEAAPQPGDFGNPLENNNSNPLSSFDTPTTGALLASVPFANSAGKLGPQGLKTVEKIAAQWQRQPKNLSVSAFASGLRSATANQALANARSHAVKQQLVTLGVPANQIRLVANGNNQNKTPHVDVFVDSE